MQNLKFRKTTFSPGGMGTKRVQISGPPLVCWKKRDRVGVALIFRDEERGGKVSLALTGDVQIDKWRLYDLTTFSVGVWELSYDTAL